MEQYNLLINGQPKFRLAHENVVTYVVTNRHVLIRICECKLCELNYFMFLSWQYHITTSYLLHNLGINTFIFRLFFLYFTTQIRNQYQSYEIYKSLGTVTHTLNVHQNKINSINYWQIRRSIVHNQYEVPHCSWNPSNIQVEKDPKYAKSIVNRRFLVTRAIGYWNGFIRRSSICISKRSHLKWKEIRTFLLFVLSPWIVVFLYGLRTSLCGNFVFNF